MLDEADPFHLQRFVDSQDPVFDSVIKELKEGHKRTHWMWFVFPQLAGLGHSETARYFAIASPLEAQAYFNHALLGPRLRDCTERVNAVSGRSIELIFGFPDHLKFHSSMTLFNHAIPEACIFGYALDRYFSGQPDAATLNLISGR